MTISVLAASVSACVAGAIAGAALGAFRNRPVADRLGRGIGWVHATTFLGMPACHGMALARTLPLAVADASLASLVAAVTYAAVRFAHRGNRLFGASVLAGAVTAAIACFVSRGSRIDSALDVIVVALIIGFFAVVGGLVGVPLSLFENPQSAATYTSRSPREGRRPHDVPRESGTGPNGDPGGGASAGW